MADGGWGGQSGWFQALVEHAQDWIVVVLDAQTMIRSASPSIERVLGYRPEERLGRPSDELLHPDDREMLGAALAGLLETLASLAAAALVGLERSRLEGVLLAARSAQHALNNQLALTLGYTDVLAADPRLPADLREVAHEALSGAQAAAGTVQQLRQITRLDEIDRAGPGPVLDIARSAEDP